MLWTVYSKYKERQGRTRSQMPQRSTQPTTQRTNRARVLVVKQAVSGSHPQQPSASSQQQTESSPSTSPAHNQAPYPVQNMELEQATAPPPPEQVTVPPVEKAIIQPPPGDSVFKKPPPPSYDDAVIKY